MTDTAAQFAAHQKANRHLYELNALKVAEGFELNQNALHAFVGSVGGHKVSRDVVASDIAWLKEQGLVRTKVVDNVTVATITERGLDVVDGNTTVPGVARPLPT
jgi:hypothetical protein